MNRLQSTFRFLWPTLLVTTSFLIAILVSHLVFEASDDEGAQIEELSRSIDSLALPSPELTPDQVVGLQVAGLADEHQARGIIQCMVFASRDNFAVTGPFERFREMLRTERFRVLADPDRFLVGRPTIVDEKARVLVTLVQGKELKSFVWVLSKQDFEPVAGCWMTDAVFPVDFGDRGRMPALPGDDVI